MKTLTLKEHEVLVLKRCREGSTSHNGFVYPKKGIVEAPDWNNKPECGGGLHGWTAGFAGYFDYSLAGHFIIILVDKRDGYVEIEDKVKFRKGMVLLNTPNVEEAYAVMRAHYPNMRLHWSTQIAWFQSTQTAGDESTQIAGYESTQAAGDNSTQTAGYESTQTAGDNSTQTAGYYSTQTARDYSTQTAGYYSTQTAEDSSTQIAGNHSTQTAGECSTQIAWYNSVQIAEYNSTQTAGNSSVSIQRTCSDTTSIIRFAENSVAVLFDDDGVPSVYTEYQNETVYFYGCKPKARYTTTPENITKLKTHEVFVFGSNLAGNHAGGAAAQAVKFGAQMGVGEGITEKSYALPTLNADLSKRTLDEIRKSAETFIQHARKDTSTIFLLTKVGCGIAGFKEEEIAPLFENAPANVIKPKGW